jgi:hypothetical protein
MEPYDLDEIIAEWGARYQDEGQTMANVHSQLFQIGGLEEYFPMQPEDSDHFKGVYTSVDEVLQAFSIPFTPKGKVTFKPVEQRLGEFKIDTSERPDDFRKTYMGFLSQHAKDADRSSWGIIEWILREMKIPSANQSFKLDVAYFGWQWDFTYAAVPVVNGTTFQRQLTSASNPLPANASMDGIRTQIARWAAAGRTTAITVGAWDADEIAFCTQIEEFVWDSSATTLRSRCDYLHMSVEMARKYRSGRRKKYNINWGQVEDLDVIVDTTIKVKGHEDMNGSENVWMTPAMNRVKPTRGTGGKLFDVQKEKREVHILGDWMQVLTFHVPEFIVHSEHDTTISAGDITALYTEA